MALPQDCLCRRLNLIEIWKDRNVLHLKFNLEKVHLDCATLHWPALRWTAHTTQLCSVCSTLLSIELHCATQHWRGLPYTALHTPLHCSAWFYTTQPSALLSPELLAGIQLAE